MSDWEQHIARVEAGEKPIGRMPPSPDTYWVMLMGEAFDGSLDAALRLHDALLPGWGWETGVNATFTSIAQVWKDGRSSAFQGVSEHPARAWLLSILRALKAQDGRE